MGYLVPAGCGEAEFTEKRSRFIGYVRPVETEAEAREMLSELKSKHYDARHNCWCCIIREGGILRYSDDGEPQGTAGQPMLEVFRRSGVENVSCVVTRYFGGILLGAGGLTRAYAHAAKIALDAAGIAEMRRWIRLRASCPYSLFERVRNEAENRGCLLENAEYGADIALTLLAPEDDAVSFSARLKDMTAGAVCASEDGSVFKAAPIK
ncbi:MAG: YigZ family protein [Oscillospiraceae bacterium]|nr:YigZ family protein [Oscillospiraceae bacterium]